ncbi:hypothetical protein GCM10011487_00190 [Steroidobacter agaridevorans]|uniref:Hydrolase n=1 Tax=Steroidobacter agaridevorans TaxID=2695856 RepID=A0A829Y4F6_9GAMM|nr:HAD family phosphatase [Steroidobacter agaridevorans]GFE78019.1 hypothetical protein GCM10011487_00190 [Steroidobacter agaridevorans]
MSHDIRLVVFDFDGVMIDFEPQLRLQFLERLTGRPGADIHAAIWGSDFEREAEAGAYRTGDAYLAAFNDRLGYRLSREQWVAARRSAMRLRPDMVDYARSLSERVRLALLTNNGALLHEALPELVPEVCGVFARSPVESGRGPFDTPDKRRDFCRSVNLHASYEFGARKPDPLVFTRLLEHCRVPARQAVFVDDDDQFIQGAISAGMHGIHFQNLPTLRATLEPMLSSLSLYTAT